MDMISGGQHGFSLAGMFLLYLMFSLYQGRLASELYWNARRGKKLEEEAVTLAAEKRHAEHATESRATFWPT
jgi:hypothetical protein